MDPLCTTSLLRLIPSLSPGYSTAPDPHGPGLPCHEPSVKATIVVSVGSPNKIFYHLFAFIRDHNKVRFVLVGHMVNIKSKKKIDIGNGFLYPELKCF
jgi:hypothetical protein